MLIYAAEEHPVVEVQTRRDADILKQHERCRTAQRVLQAVVPILHETRLKEVFLLTRNRVSKTTVILQTNLLIPFLFAYAHLPLEWIDTAHAYC